MPRKASNWNIPEDESDLTDPPTSDDEDEIEEEKQNKNQSAHLPTPKPPPTHIPPPPPKSLGRSKTTRPSTQQATQQSRARRDPAKENYPTLTATSFTHPVYYLVDLMEGDRIDVNPEYQRGVVWNEAKQGALIDSLLHGYHTPSIVLAKGMNEDGLDVWRCIDGKQRLTSLYRFCHGEIPYKDSHTNKKYWFVNQPGQKRRLMTPILKSKLREKCVTINEYTSITEEQERAVFQRVQLGVVLGPADRLPAINGANADLIRELRRRINTTEGFDGYLDWGKARGKDFQALARIVYFIAFGQTRKWDPITMRLETFLGSRADNYVKLRAKSIQTVDIFCRISLHSTLSSCFDDLSPLEFVMSNYLISRECHRLTDSQLSAAITRMRQDYTKQNKDFKCGKANYKVMMTFMDKQLPKLIHSVTTLPGEKVAAVAPINRRELSYDQFMDVADQPPDAETSKKRKRASAAADDGDVADSEEDDYVVAKTRPLKKSKESAPSSTPMRQTSSSKTSLAKTTVKKSPATRKPEAATAVPSATSSNTKSSPSSTNQPIVKPSRPSRSVISSCSGASPSGPSHRQTTGIPSRSTAQLPSRLSTQQNFQGGSSQTTPPNTRSTVRPPTDRLGPLKRARAETQTNVHQNPAQSQSVTDESSWGALAEIIKPKSTLEQTVPPPPMEKPRSGPSQSPPLQIPQPQRQESLGSPLTAISTSPSPMPGAYSPACAQDEPQSNPQPPSHPQAQAHPQPQPQPQQTQFATGSNQHPQQRSPTVP